MDFKNFSLMLNETKVAPYADSLAQGKIMATRCKKCNGEYYPPQSDCSQCLSKEMDWFECPSEGKLVTFTQVMVLPEHFALPRSSIPFSKAVLTPSPVGILEVKEGIRIMGWIPKTMAGDLKVGDRMKANAHTLDDGRVTITFERIE